MKFLVCNRIKYPDEMKCINDITPLMVLLKNQGAYTEQISISPELIQICNINYVILAACSGLRHRWIQTNIIKVHHTRTTGYRIAPVTKTKGNRSYVGEIHALVGKGLQVDIPYRPGSYLR